MKSYIIAFRKLQAILYDCRLFPCNSLQILFMLLHETSFQIWWGSNPMYCIHYKIKLITAWPLMMSIHVLLGQNILFLVVAVIVLSKLKSHSWKWCIKLVIESMMVIRSYYVREDKALCWDIVNGNAFKVLISTVESMKQLK